MLLLLPDDGDADGRDDDVMVVYVSVKHVKVVSCSCSTFAIATGLVHSEGNSYIYLAEFSRQYYEFGSGFCFGLNNLAHV